MLQYLVNATAIWLISLVLFDVFLRKESFHNYNRFYLLFTFLLGALLPLWQWQNDIMPYTGTFHKPIEKVIATKQDLVTVSTTSTVAFNWQQWILLCYLAGSVIALILLIADVLRMVQFYNKGTKTYSDGWKVVTTGKDHAPFSFYNILFVASRSQYSDEEWQMILIHEKRQTQLLHIIDLILMQVARIIFWFHPLVYIFNKRLLLVQEFQADGASYVKPDEYGTFLVEQALLQKAPSLSHSFNRTPIKNRIIIRYF